MVCAESGLYYALRGTSSSVLIEHEDRYWVWHQRGPIPSGIQYRRERSVSNSSSTSGTSSSSGKRKLEQTAENPLDRVARDIGRRMLDVAGWDPEEYRDLMDKLTAAELRKAAAAAGSLSSMSRPTSRIKRVPDDLHSETAAHEETATRTEATKGKEAATSTSVSTRRVDRADTAGTTVDRAGLTDRLGSRQTTVFDRLGNADGVGLTRTVMLQPVGGGGVPTRVLPAQ